MDINNQSPRLSRVWFVLLAGPILFFLLIVAASIFFGILTQGDAAAIPERVTASTPYLLVILQVLLLLTLLWAMRRDGLVWKNIGWELTQGQKLWREALVGAVPGIALGFLYIFILAPLMVNIQKAFGDYVPAGELLPALGGALLPFFVANVLLAPWVEESIYRGYAITRLRSRYRMVVATILSCFFFGLLHWTGGFWYMLLTGVVAGGLFAGLLIWRKNIITPFAAHLALNIVEFLLVWMLG